MARDWREDRIEELERENAQLHARVGEQEAVIETQRQTISAQERRIHELEAKLGQSSGNSSRPPSSDPPGTPPPAPPKRRTGRRRGGQPGHDKQTRSLVAPEQVTRTHVVKPCACRHCFKPLAGEDPSPYRHQVIDIPKVQATVEEYQLHTLTCEACGTSTRATLPEGVPTGQFGPRLQATVAVCTGAYKLSKRDTEELIEDFFGVPISLGSVANLEQATSKAIAAPVAEVAKAIQKAPVVHADETGWYERSKRAWLWVATTAVLAVFLISKSRGAEVAMTLLGKAFG
jgi:transposase